MPDFLELVKQTKAVDDQEVPKLREQFEDAEQLLAELEAVGKKDTPAYATATAIREQIRGLLKEHRERLLQIGAAGRMLMKGELAEIVALDDEAAHNAASGAAASDGTNREQSAGANSALGSGRTRASGALAEGSSPFLRKT